LIALPACAPRALVKPIPADTPPAKVLEMARAKDAGIKGIRASVKVSVQMDGKNAQGFDGVLYVQKPDKVRLTGLAFMGFTVFDILVNGDKFYFYQPDDGYLYTGPKSALGGFLEKRGVKADPDVLYRSLFFDMTNAQGRYFFDSTAEGYNIFFVHEQDGVTVPLMRAEYDRGLGLKEKVFYDELARPYLYVRFEGTVEEGGYTLPAKLVAKDTKNGYTVTVTFEKYLVNPEGLDGDFAIEGGELKGIREIE